MGDRVSYQCKFIEMSSQPAVAVPMMTTFQNLPETIGDGFASIVR